MQLTAKEPTQLLPRVTIAARDLCRCIRWFLQTANVVESIHIRTLLIFHQSEMQGI